jgi:hypothetical protein
VHIHVLRSRCHLLPLQIRRTHRTPVAYHDSNHQARSNRREGQRKARLGGPDSPHQREVSPTPNRPIKSPRRGSFGFFSVLPFRPFATGEGMATSGGQGAVEAAEAPLAGGKQGGNGGGGGEGGHAGAAGGKAAKTAESMDEFTKRSFTATQKILREQRCALKSHASPWLCTQERPTSIFWGHTVAPCDCSLPDGLHPLMQTVVWEGKRRRGGWEGRNSEEKEVGEEGGVE